MKSAILDIATIACMAVLTTIVFLQGREIDRYKAHYQRAMDEAHSSLDAADKAVALTMRYAARADSLRTALYNCDRNCK